jgi:hypothetical protein
LVREACGDQAQGMKDGNTEDCVREMCLTVGLTEDQKPPAHEEESR